MTQKRSRKRANPQEYMPDADRVAAELAKAESMDDIFGKESIFAKLETRNFRGQNQPELR